MIQPVCFVNGALHVHSQIFPSIEKAKEALAKNKSYVWFGYIEVNVLHEDSLTFLSEIEQLRYQNTELKKLLNEKKDAEK